jgi:hypothetical protein
VYLISGCSRPDRDDGTCSELLSLGIHSVLVLTDDVTPFHHACLDGFWSYVLPLSDPAKPIPAERVRMADFVSYELRHGRTVGVWVGYTEGRERLVRHLADSRSPEPNERPLPDSPCCCRPYRDGCHGTLLCHGTTADAAQAILDSGRLISKAALSGMAESQLQSYARNENVGDPPDYYRYVCLANGDCIAPDLVAASRRLGRFVRASELNTDFYPAIRFFFDTRELFSHPKAEWDGICALKIRDELALRDVSFVVVTPEVEENGGPLRLGGDEGVRIIRLNHKLYSGLAAWSAAAAEGAEDLLR